MVAILADDIFKCILLNENDRIPIQVSLKFVRRSPIDNKAALAQVIIWTNADPIHWRTYAALGVEGWVGGWGWGWGGGGGGVGVGVGGGGVGVGGWGGWGGSEHIVAEQNGLHFVDIFKCIFVDHVNVYISDKISLKYVGDNIVA